MANSSITINFTTKDASDIAAGLSISIDLDKEKNEDVTNFAFGDTAYFRVFTDGTTINCYQSAGAVGSHGTSTTELTEILTFTEPPESVGGEVVKNIASLSQIPIGAPTWKQLGGSSMSFSMDPKKSKQVNASKAGVAVVQATYTAKYYSKSISNVNTPTDWPAGTSYPVVIVVVVT